MRNLLYLLVFVVGAFFAGKYVGERKAEAMIDVAAAMGEDGRYEEGLKQLDAVQSWFAWTDAAARVGGEREAIRERMRDRDEQRRWESRWAEEDRARRAEEAEARQHERILERMRERESPSTSPSPLRR